MLTGGLVFPLIGTLISHLKATANVSNATLAWIPVILSQVFYLQCWLFRTWQGFFLNGLRPESL